MGSKVVRITAETYSIALQLAAHLQLQCNRDISVTDALHEMATYCQASLLQSYKVTNVTKLQASNGVLPLNNPPLNSQEISLPKDSLLERVQKVSPEMPTEALEGKAPTSRSRKPKTITPPMPSAPEFILEGRATAWWVHDGGFEADLCTWCTRNDVSLEQAQRGMLYLKGTKKVYKNYLMAWKNAALNEKTWALERATKGGTNAAARTIAVSNGSGSSEGRPPKWKDFPDPIEQPAGKP